MRGLASRGAGQARDAQRAGEERRTIRSVCGGCHNCCPINVEVQDNRVLRVSGVPGDPRTGGAICSKGQAGPQIAHDPRRLLYPVRRAGERGEGKWKRVSWDDALDPISSQANYTMCLGRVDKIVGDAARGGRGERS
ncbi:MAG: molybdopterin-dependent oxidoreductase [Coriobacteriales bacterium]